MTNITFEGKLVDVNGHVLTRYHVNIYQIDNKFLSKDIKLGDVLTDSKGEFKFVYLPDTEETSFADKSEIRLEIEFNGEKIYEINYAGKFKGKIIDFGKIEVKGPNRGIKGRILNENGEPFEGLVVVAEGAGKTEARIMDSDAIKLADKLSPVSLRKDFGLGQSHTDENGYYEIMYPPSSYSNLLNENPDIWVVVRDLLDVAELYRTEKFSAVSDTIKTLDDIHINQNWAEGWFVTLGGSDKSRFTTDNQLEILVDNEVELETLVQSINNSKSFVCLTQFEFEPDFVATFESDDELIPKDVLVEVLRKAAERGVEVRIILNENLAVPDSYKEINEYFEEVGVEVREFKSQGLHVMHAKIMIVDGREAFVIGSPFKQDYWDTSHHLINDPRREPEFVRPVHDVSVKLRGGSVYHVEEFFTEMWNYISREEYNGNGMINTNTIPIQSGEEQLQIARSVTPDTLSIKGELGIFEGYRKAIGMAKDFIYLENQYLTNSSVVKALKNAMANNEYLQIMVVINENPDIPKYKEWQNQGLEKFGIKTVEDNLEHPQIGFFTLWSAGWGEEQFEIQPIYVHSKVAVVDDMWATIGTANLDGSSLTHVNELEGFFDVKFHRNMEMNVIIPEEESIFGEAEKIRKTLWKEHLGIGYSSIKNLNSSWLEIWQKTAQNNIKSLNNKSPYLNSHILPYSPEKTVKNQLEDMNIDTRGWNLLD